MIESLSTGSTAAAAPPAAASPPAPASPPAEMSLADIKFKEGVDQAAANRLDEAEVTVVDPSDFEGALAARGAVLHGRHRVITLEAPSVPNALAALTLHVRDVSGVVPHIYFEWTEGSPVHQLLRFLLFGQGEVAPVTREVLRRAEHDRTRRPRVHVG